MALFTFGGRGPMDCCQSAAGTLAKITLVGRNPGMKDSLTAAMQGWSARQFRYGTD